MKQLLDSWRKDAGSLQEQALAGSEYVREQYSPEREEQDIVGIWQTLMRQFMV